MGVQSHGPRVLGLRADARKVYWAVVEGSQDRLIVVARDDLTAGDALLEPVRQRVDRELSITPVLMRSVLGADAQLHGAIFGAFWQLDPDLALREELR